MKYNYVDLAATFSPITELQTTVADPFSFPVGNAYHSVTWP